MARRPKGKMPHGHDDEKKVQREIGFKSEYASTSTNDYKDFVYALEWTSLFSSLRREGALYGERFPALHVQALRV